MGNEQYIIRGGEEGRERLRLLSEVMGPTTRALLADVGIRTGSLCLDVGCGGGDVTFELVRLTGPDGRAVGVDIDQVKITLARKDAAEQGLSNLDFLIRDITEWKPDEVFDVVYARFLLTHLRNPGQVISAMQRCIRPGGVIIVEDIDFRGHFSEPDCPALQRYVDYYTKAAQARGGDPNIGPRLPGLLRSAGFENVQMKVIHPAALEGGIKLLTCVTLENITEAVLRDKLSSEENLRATAEELHAFCRDPKTVLGGPRIFQVWGRNSGR
ncbi:MAG: Demethylmenaquinone methyltransferase [Pseudomonadota bacterium]|jgi:ubiquinone/menaquinone biosynthesis C-methylase UbiE